MKIKVDYFENEIEINSENIFAIEIENKKYFFNFIMNLYEVIENGYSDKITFFDSKFSEIKMTNKITIYSDFFNMNLENKKIENEIYKIINSNISSDMHDCIIKEYKKIHRYYNNIINNIDLPICLEETNIENLTKTLKFKIKSNIDLINNLFTIIDLESALKSNKILIFINLKLYLTNNELEELYKYSIYNNIKIILIDSVCYGCTLKYEKKLIIDNDLEEFML